MIRQYNKIKSENPDCLVFFRLGDFFELFNEDARIASGILGLNLTSRNASGREMPMCGIPHASLDDYARRLALCGHKVAVCDQVGSISITAKSNNGKKSKEILQREVIRIVTPATANIAHDTENDNSNQENPENSKNTYIMSIFQGDISFGMAYCDPVCGGDFFVAEFGIYNFAQMLEEIIKLNPVEVIISKNFLKAVEIKTALNLRMRPQEYIPEDFFDAAGAKAANEMLCKHFKVDSLEDFGLPKNAIQIAAAAGLMNYLQQTQKVNLDHITKISKYLPEQFMILDAIARQNLELTETIRDKSKTGSLMGIIDQTKTRQGARLLRSWLENPLLKKEDILTRQNAIADFKSNPKVREDIRKALCKIKDIQRVCGKMVFSKIKPQDLNNLAVSINQISFIIETMSVAGFESPLSAYFINETDLLDDISKTIQTAINPESSNELGFGKVFNPGYSEKLDMLIKAQENADESLANLERSERKRTGISSLKIRKNKIFGYYIETTHAQSAKVPNDYIRRQTMANAERFTTAELNQIQDIIFSSSEEVANLEKSLFDELIGRIIEQVPRIQQTAQIIAMIDVLQSLGEIADLYNYVAPKFNNANMHVIEDGRHPVVEKIMEEQPGAGLFVANDVYLDSHGQIISIITGPNMAGKSTYLRQVALITILAQMGSFVPAKSADLSICDRIFTRVGASDNLTGAQSTFMVEMHEVANFLKNATENSLLILDEIGRGTSTTEGFSIALAIIEYIAKKIKAKTLFATHFHELIETQHRIEGIANFCFGAKEEGKGLVFVRKLQEGGADHSYGIQVAEMAGVPNIIIERSKEIQRKLAESGAYGAAYAPDSGRRKRTELPSRLYLEEYSDDDIVNMSPKEVVAKLLEERKYARDVKEREHTAKDMLDDFSL